jgi:hypothetical protein
MTVSHYKRRALVVTSLLLAVSAALAQAGGSNTAGMAGTGSTSSMTGDSSSGTAARPPGQSKPDPDSDAARKARSDPRAEGSGSRGGNTNPAPTGLQDADSNGRSVSPTGKKIIKP